MSRNTAAFQPSRNSFTDALESTIGLSADPTATDEGSRTSSTDKRWNQAALRRAVRRLQSRATQGEPARVPSSVVAKTDQLLSSSNGTLSYEKALRLLARVNLDSDELDASSDYGSDKADRKGAKARRPGSKAPLSYGTTDLSDDSEDEVHPGPPAIGPGETASMILPGLVQSRLKT